MATLNYAFKEISCKIVFYGCGLCGKTTNLQFIHNSVPQKFRGELVSLATEQDRTLFFDFLPLDLGEVKGFKTKFQLYTVPGQVYYNATRKLVLRGVDGIVFVVDSQRDRLKENLDSLQNLKDNLQEYGYNLDEIPWVLQYNKRDMADVMDLEELQRTFNKGGIPYYESVATTGVGVRETLKGISGLVIRHLNQDRTGVLAPSPAPSGEAKAAAPATPPAMAKVPVVARPAASAAPAVPPAPAAAGATPAPPSPASRALPPSAASLKPPAAPVPSAAPSPPPPRAAEPRQAPSESAPASAPAPAPAPEPVQAKIRVETVRDEASESQISTLKSQESKAPPPLESVQKCDVRWRRLRVGSGQLTLSLRDNSDGRGAYQLAGSLSFLGIRKTWARLLDHRLLERKNFEGEEAGFHRLESAPGDEGPVLTLWVKAAYDKQMYIYYEGFGGPVRVVPEGKRATP